MARYVHSLVPLPFSLVVMLVPSRKFALAMKRSCQHIMSMLYALALPHPPHPPCMRPSLRLLQVESWIMEHGTEWVGESWDELKFIRQVRGSQAALVCLAMLMASARKCLVTWCILLHSHRKHTSAVAGPPPTALAHISTHVVHHALEAFIATGATATVCCMSCR
jgi:hypothetical protein